jgi:hypothetical protein
LSDNLFDSNIQRRSAPRHHRCERRAARKSAIKPTSTSSGVSSRISWRLAFGDLPHVFFQRFRESMKRAEWKKGFESRQRIVDDLAAGRVEAAVAEFHASIESHEEPIR